MLKRKLPIFILFYSFATQFVFLDSFKVYLQKPVLFVDFNLNLMPFDRQRLSSQYHTIYSLLILSKFLNSPQFFFFYLFRNLFVLNGGLVIVRIMENFLRFLKLQYRIDSMLFVFERTLRTIYLPFRLYSLRAANKKIYSFAVPILSEYEYQTLILKNFRNVISKKSGNLVDRFFSELLLFFSKDPESHVLQQLEQMLVQGVENRAHLHYRWLVRR